MDRAKLIAAMQTTAAEKPRPVEIKGWGTVYVKSLTVEEADDTSEEQVEADTKNRTRIARAAAKVLCDENGKLLFDPENNDDLALLKKQPWKLLRKIVADDDETPKGNSARAKS